LSSLTVSSMSDVPSRHFLFWRRNLVQFEVPTEVTMKNTVV
jgi:hypothetical protein